MEKKKRAQITLELTRSLEADTDREAVDPLIGLATSMLRELATQTPRAAYQWDGSDDIWHMELRHENAFTEPFLAVTFPGEKEPQAYFRAITLESWGDFVRSVQMVTQKVPDLVQSIPELKDVSFEKSPVPYPKSLEKLAEPPLVICSQHGFFTIQFLTLSEFLDSYYPEPQPKAEALA